ncbi:transcription termination factor Rho, partial [Mycobacterium avium 09-5983]
RSASRDAGAAGRGNDDADRETDGREQNKQDSREQSKQDGGDQDQQSSGGQQGRGSNQQDDDGEGRQGRRGRRFRDRRRRGERSGEGGDAELREDDVVQPVAGILDVLDNYAFVRTSGYLAGPHDVYVSMNMVRKNGLRRGDAVTGAVRVPKDGEQPNQRQKFNPLVRLDSVNGGSVEDAKKRPEFGKLTPLYPNQRLRLETTPDRLTTRVIDLIMPIGKGQRALIVSPPKAGKTTILQDIANAITKNNPECHLMVVLVDERPEEVTDMQRSVKGEVIASTFDRPPSDHTSVAELAIERAKRLVEQGKDVVVLLDSITRLGRAYNNASPASGRILSGGVDSTALYPPKRFLGAARNIEEGGSLTIIATAMVETGSTGDTVIFEEFKGTGNAELKLDRKIAERRVFPAVDVNPSGTRKDELLLSPDEFGIVHKLRRVLSGLDSHQAIDLLMSQLRKTKNNYEFLVQVSKTTPGAMDND